MKSLIFYLLTILIWGSTWIAIKFQIYSVDPMVSLSLRFLLASFVLIIWCRVFRLKMRFKREEFFFMVLQGFFLFGINYLLIYTSELYLTSGLCAVIFSSILLMNVVNSHYFLGTPIEKKVVLGGITGLLGIFILFMPEVLSFSSSGKEFTGLLFAFLGTVLASFGNIISARNQKNKIPILQTNAYGMGVGGIMMLALSVFTGKSFYIDWTFSYVSSLLYLSLFGTIAAFGFYLHLVGKIGPERASYTTLFFPVVALLISAVWEGYSWTFSTFIGMGLIIFGNLLILKKKNIKPAEFKDCGIETSESLSRKGFSG